jgi:transcriptional regulator with XRE-family HTH domain
MRRTSDRFDPTYAGAVAQSVLSGQPRFGGNGGTDVAGPTDRWTKATYASQTLASQDLARLAGDAKLAAVFKQIRSIVGVSESEMARRLGTDITVILDFESGAVEAFPPWPVTARLIERYAAMADVDPSPILARILSLQAQVLPIPAPRPRQALAYGDRPTQPFSPNSAQPQGQPYTQRPGSTTADHPEPYSEPVTAGHAVGFEARSKLRTQATGAPRTLPPDTPDVASEPVSRAKRRRRMRRALTLAIPMGLIAAVFVILQATPRPLYAFASMMPGPLAAPTRSLVDLIVLQSAPVKDGLRWIDMGDPRIRKGDRLPSR